MLPMNFSFLERVFLFVFSASPNESSLALLLSITSEQAALRVGYETASETKPLLQ